VGDHGGRSPNECVASASATARRLSQVTVVHSPASRTLLVAGVLIAGALVRFLFAGLIPLFGDEAYYWEWSRHLAAGYFDHPPGIPLLIRAGTAVAGNVALGVRLFPVLAGFVAGLATAGVAKRLGGEG